MHAYASEEDLKLHFLVNPPQMNFMQISVVKSEMRYCLPDESSDLDRGLILQLYFKAKKRSYYEPGIRL